MVASSRLLGNRTPIVGRDATLRHPSTGGRTDSPRPPTNGVVCRRSVVSHEEERPLSRAGDGLTGGRFLPFADERLQPIEPPSNSLVAERSGQQRIDAVGLSASSCQFGSVTLRIGGQCTSAIG